MSMLLAIGSGSSPRVRGSRSAAQSLQRSDGIIPAGAGLTCTSCTHGTRQRDHPRGCGAHIVSHDMLTIRPGSSPRVRGSRVERIEVISVPGIIPAGAGLTNDKGHRMLPDGDHPRGCGAHSLEHEKIPREQGSSPRVRGSLGTWSDALAALGIIPAGAGLTSRSPFGRRTARDHPRGCGAHRRWSL